MDFQAINWDFYHQTINNSNRVIIQIFGRTKSGQDVYVKVVDFKLHFYIDIPDEFFNDDVAVNTYIPKEKSNIYGKDNNNVEDDYNNDQDLTKKIMAKIKHLSNYIRNRLNKPSTNPKYHKNFNGQNFIGYELVKTKSFFGFSTVGKHYLKLVFDNYSASRETARILSNGINMCFGYGTPYVHLEFNTFEDDNFFIRVVQANCIIIHLFIFLVYMSSLYV